ncbi:hypothetical protein VNO78_08132 [Psophocarpus tetragonolobus]|uniref:Uncharacterized protein n=1 Tax=Psophocarpus tetragonolobus TaxID=3891 RepID=A0AAN9SXB3_PSOTE
MEDPFPSPSFDSVNDPRKGLIELFKFHKITSEEVIYILIYLVNMNQQAKNESVNAENPMEKKVETVEYRSSAGQGQEERKVQVIHQPHSTKTNDGVLSAAGAATGAAAAVIASTLQSAKDAVSKK